VIKHQEYLLATAASRNSHSPGDSCHQPASYRLPRTWSILLLFRTI